MESKTAEKMKEKSQCCAFRNKSDFDMLRIPLKIHSCTVLPRNDTFQVFMIKQGNPFCSKLHEHFGNAHHMAMRFASERWIWTYIKRPLETQVLWLNSNLNHKVKLNRKIRLN